MVSKTSKNYIFHHVFLPPKLPHGEDGRIEHDAVLTQVFHKELVNFHVDLAPKQKLQFGRVIEMVKGILSGEDDITTPSSKIIKNLKAMKIQDICAIHIEKQNAGIIIRRFEEEYIFETFELSPKNVAVMTTMGRLRRSFPGPAVAVSQHHVNEEGFQEALSQCIESLVRDTPIIVHPKISKAHTTDVEIRDTVDPTLITSMLTECLHAIGRRVAVRRIQKRTRDVVQWKDCFEPWRRSPRYLFLRVCLQIGLIEEEGHEPLHIQYKSFMLFFMCQILKRQLWAQDSREILFIMSMKVQRRLLKLGSALDSDLKSRVQEVLSLVTSVLRTSSPSLLSQPRPDTSILKPQQDTALTLHSLEPYIAMISARGKSNLDHTSLEPQCNMRMVQMSIGIASIESLSASLGEDIKKDRLTLADIEMWVADYLPRWPKWYYTFQLDCAFLAGLISIYQKTSDRVYKDIAEDQSLKMLTLLDLWVALDKCVTSEEPLLKDYRCGFTSDLFGPLLLPTKPQMIRLASIERYIADRNAASVDEMPCIFSKINASNSFSVRYFDKSLRHQHLRDRIMADAVTERNQKLLELNTKLQAFEAWKEADLLSVCEEKEFVVGKKANCRTELRHKAKKCQKCIAKACVNKIKVAVHEFPLPESELETKSVVFELDVPTIISTWRDRTYSLLIDTFSSRPKILGSVAYYYLDKSPLERYVQNSHGRIRLGSESKPFIVSHYKEKAISLATTENILKPSGLSFQVLDFDVNYGTAIAIATNFLSLLNIRKFCTMVLAPECAELQYSLESTAHTTNQALARQSHCPTALTLSEYYQFSSLRSGLLLLWMNILREIESRVLDLNRKESFQLIAQAAWQAGPADCMQPFRDSHSDLDDKAFGVHLLEALNRLVSSVESNWQGGGAIRIVTMLATRLLSVSSHESIQEGCLQLLLRIRIITTTWTRDVVNLIHDCQDENKLESLELRALELSLTCSGTFDVDIHHLRKILESVESQAIFIESLITVHDRCPMSINDLTAVTKMCLRRFDRITHRAERDLRDMVTRQAQSIDTTVQFLWPGYKPGAVWTALKTPNERWLRTRTAKCSGQVSLFVDFNILNGELLINGSPLARLPHNYEEHPTYKRLFGKKMLEVIPSTMPGMAFENRNLICEQQIHFNMIDNELIVRTRGNGECFEVIPKRILTVDFTDKFVEDYIFMRNDGTGVIQLRPVENPLMFPENGWQITNLPQQHYHLTNGLMTAVDIRSQSATTVSDILRPLERTCYIDMIVNQHNEQLEIRLTRFNLNFYKILGDWRLTSKQFRGMFVDEDQTIGTFTGLANKLVLCNSDRSKRIVIIPDGEITSTPHKGHVKVDIILEPKDFHAYHDYTIDTQLGRLIDNGSLHTRLFRSYLHALTSDVLPDVLTGKTGTEEALEILSSAAVFSFYTLSSRQIDLLVKLRALSPKLVYYPKHKRSMQTVSWSQLPTLSQHGGFSTKVECIFKHARSLSLFQDKSEKQVEIPEPDDRGLLTLICMAAIRNSFCFVDMFGAEEFTIIHDKEYDARDGNCDTDRRAAIYDIARLVSSWTQDLNIVTDLLGTMKSLARPIIGPNTHTLSVLGYDTKWLDAPSEFLPEHWFAIYQMLTSCNEDRDKYKVMIFLSTLVFSRKTDQAFVHTLLAFATNSSFRYIKLPRYNSFSLPEGFEPKENRLNVIIASAVKNYDRTPASILERGQSETEHEVSIRRQTLYSSCRKSAIDVGVESYMIQWPIEKPIAAEDDKYWAYVDVLEANAIVQRRFMSWFRNKEFMEYIQLVQATLYTMPPTKSIIQPWNDYTNHKEEYKPRLTYISLKDLLKNRAPLFFSSTHLFHFDSFLIRTPISTASVNDYRNVSQLLWELSRHTSGNFETQYNSHFQQSLDALRKIPSVQLESSALACDFVNCVNESQILVRKMYLKILEQLVSSVDKFGSIENVTILPRLSHVTILSLIADSHPIKLSSQWKRAIVLFGVALSTLQRLERLVACCSNKAELLMELSNPGHQGWDPLSHPDWLLLELENGILIRKDQADISSEMIDPSSGVNSVMQLNMGLGKSSVIVPIVASTLADKTKLCRVVVLRALSNQMRGLLIKKLGAMINRRVFYLPISRSQQMNMEKAQNLRDIYQLCMSCGGVLLVQPEHLLSLELMGYDMLLSDDKDMNVGKIMRNTQEWLLENSRDILDESDEILNVRFELIYTIGPQQPIDFSPDRWMIIQGVLTIMNSFVQAIGKQSQDNFEIEHLEDIGSFARFRILRTRIGHVFLEKVARHICDQGLPGLSFFRFTKMDRDLLYRFIIDPKTTEKDLSSLHRSLFATQSMKKRLLLLRGLFAHGVLHFAFSQKQRWRVNFGLDLKRSSLAVPYHGKDVPTTVSEFSHPETTIVLTCLAYYYEGLSESQAMECFRELLKSDNGQQEYEKWIRNCSHVGAKFKRLNSVNLSNQRQWSEHIYTHLKRSKRMIDFYLSHLIFPKEMKEFPKKLSSSGWDIAQTKKYPLTGFSGTNDSRFVLPLSVQQQELIEQISTNAEVLACLLRPENSFDSTTNSEVLSAEVLINLAIQLKPTVRVILDVGAQVLELRNEEVASRWLCQLPAEVQGAIFFDSSDELCVLNRDDLVEALSISPFSKQMDRCVIYLDEAHTRGTDLQLPSDYRALVTLGPEMTKDRLAQACMRMRKLGRGQSVVMCAPKDIQRKILEGTHKTQFDHIELQDVLLWCIRNTLDHVHKSVAPWAVQGKRHYERMKILNANPSVVPESIQEPEAQTLEERYGFGKDQADENWLSQKAPDTDTECTSKIADIRQKCADFGLISFADTSLQEEQERELQPEKELEVQIEHAPSVSHFPHVLHRDVKDLVISGVMKSRDSPGFFPAFKLFQFTSAKKYLDDYQWPTGLWVTFDFAKTVISGKSNDYDFFLRPVHWIVTFKEENETRCVVFSPFEVNELLPDIRKYEKVTLSIYSPRLSLSLRSFEMLDIHSIPPLAPSWTIPSVVTQLNLFAGQLYLRSYDEYIRVCQFLGLCHYSPQDNVEIDCDNFVPVSSRALFDPVMKEICPFKESQVDFLKKVFALRRKGQGFENTHMGRILNGELLSKSDFNDDEGILSGKSGY